MTDAPDAAPVTVEVNRKVTSEEVFDMFNGAIPIEAFSLMQDTDRFSSPQQLREALQSLAATSSDRARGGESEVTQEDREARKQRPDAAIGWASDWVAGRAMNNIWGTEGSMISDVRDLLEYIRRLEKVA